MKRDHHNFLHDGRKLYQQLIINQYEKMETSCLQYCFYHQKDIHCDKYQNVFDSLQAGEIKNNGKVVILSSFLQEVIDGIIIITEMIWHLFASLENLPF